MPQVWKRKGSSWRCWQSSTEQWFVLTSGQIVFEKDSHSSCKSSLALLLKMEQHTILSFVNLSSDLPLFLTPAPLFIVSAFSQSFLCRLICQCALLADPSVDAEAPHSLTDRETMLSQSPVAHGGTSTHTNEVINGLMSLFTHLATETWGGFLFRQGTSVVLL